VFILKELSARFSPFGLLFKKVLIIKELAEKTKRQVVLQRPAAGGLRRSLPLGPSPVSREFYTRKIIKSQWQFQDWSEKGRWEVARQSEWVAYRCYQTTWQTYTQHVYSASNWAWNART